MNLINRYEALESEIKDLLPEGVILNEESLKTAFSHQIDEESSWLIKFITIVGGFLGATFLVGFLIAILFSDTPIPSMVAGILIFIAVIWVSRMKENLMLYAIYVTLYFAAYILVGRSISLWQHHNDIAMEILFSTMALITLLVTRSFILNFLAWVILNGVLYFTIVNHHVGWVFHLLLLLQWGAFLVGCMQETQMMLATGYWKGRFKSYRYAMFCAVATSAFFLLFQQNGGLHIPFPWLAGIPPIMLIGWLLYRKLLVLGVLHPIPWVLLMLVALIFTIQAPYLSCCLLLLLLGFGFADRFMWMIAAGMFITSVGFFYYDLKYTLLTKSLCMMGSGLVLGAIYYFTSSKLNVDESH